MAGITLVADPRVGNAVDVHCRRGVRRAAHLSSWVVESGPIAANVPVLHASAYASMPPLLMPVAYRRFGSMVTWPAMSSTTALMNPASSMFSRPGRPQQPPTFQALPTPSG
jgi:hypothetical protein